MRVLVASAAMAIVGSTAFAGDWTGGYVGAQVGYLDVEPSGGLASGDSVAGGVHAGYNYDFGDWIIGAEAEYDWSSAEIGGGAATVENVFRLKAKVGYDFGAAFGYAVAGGARAYTDNLGDDDGWLVGAGVAYEVTPQWVVSGELLYHEFSNYNGTGVDVDATSLNLRASFRF